MQEQFVSWWRTQYTEADVQSVASAIRAEHISLGPVTAEFEAKLADAFSVPYVVATTSGSTALLMALIALGVGSGDEVIIPNRTWIAAAHAVMMVGAKVVLVDVLADTPVIDVSLIESKINSRTKAIIPTALNGRGVNIEAIKKIAEKHHLYVIEDAAQAVFSSESGAFAGTQGDIGCFSFSVAKLIPTGQGGCVLTKDKRLYQELIKIRTHGVDSLFDCHFSRFGFNFRYTDLQASIGLTQLSTVSSKIQNLRKIYELYEDGLKHNSKVRLIPVDLSKGELPVYIEALCAERSELVHYLNSRHIQSKIFYPNLNRADYFNCGETFSRADLFESQGITLPCGPSQPIEHIQRVIEAITSYENESHVAKIETGMSYV